MNVLGVIVVGLLFYFILWKPMRSDRRAIDEASQKLAGSTDAGVVKSSMKRLATEGARLDAYLDPEVRGLQSQLPGVTRETTGSRVPWQKNFVAQGAAVSHLTTKSIEFIERNNLGSETAFLWEAAVRTTDRVGETLSMLPNEGRSAFLESVATAFEEEFDVDFDEFLR